MTMYFVNYNFKLSHGGECFFLGAVGGVRSVWKLRTWKRKREEQESILVGLIHPRSLIVHVLATRCQYWWIVLK